MLSVRCSIRTITLPPITPRDRPAAGTRHSITITGEKQRMCDDFIHQGLTHDPTVSRRAFSLGAGATVALQTAVASASAKVVEKDVNVPMASGVADSALF